MSAHLFLGSTLSVREAYRHLPGSYHPPLRPSELQRVLASEPQVIGIIDGAMHGAPLEVDAGAALLRKALAWGVRVYGAGGIGAYYAARLSRAGMIGLGSVYECFRDGTLVNPQDALCMEGASSLANLHASARRAQRAGRMSAAEVKSVVRAAASLAVGERSPERVVARIERTTSARHAQRLARHLQEYAMDASRNDALDLLHLMRAAGESVGVVSALAG